jgi:hypothetical protein
MPYESSEYRPDPVAENGWVIAAFLDTVQRRVADRLPVAQLTADLQTQQRALEEAHQDWMVDPQARSNLQVSAAVLATYRALQCYIPRDELLALIREAFVWPLRDSIRTGTALMLDHAPDPFQAMRAVSKARELHFFGAGFTFERSRDDDRAYYADVTRCLWHSFFVANGAPELTPIFCEFDTNWIEAIDPARHALQFSRATTLGNGGPLCPFHFFRLPASGHNRR